MSQAPTSAIDASLDDVPIVVRDRVVLFRLLVVLGGHLRSLMDRRYRDDGITTQQAVVLAVVGASDKPLTQGDVARRLGVSHQNIRQLADSLVKKGLLEIRAKPGDRRIKRLVPTRRAPRLFARRNTADFKAIARWFSTIEDREAPLLEDMLRRLLVSVTTELSGEPAS